MRRPSGRQQATQGGPDERGAIGQRQYRYKNLQSLSIDEQVLHDMQVHEKAVAHCNTALLI